MRAQLMLTCLCDAFYGEVGIATTKVLRYAGCEVEFPSAQTCCGQPPFNSGDWAASRKIADHCKKVFSGSLAPIVCPSASCTAMLREGYTLLYPGEPHPEAYELSDFLLNVVGIKEWPKVAKPTAIAFHRSCHGRGIQLGDCAERLLEMAGVELLPFAQSEQCCGFGGAFSATHPKLSGEIGREKLRCVAQTGATTLSSGDMGCLMHLGGIIEREGPAMKVRHYVEILAEALPVEEKQHAEARG